MPTSNMIATSARVFLVILLTGFCAVLGQESSQYDKGTPPQHAAGVSSLGSYISADLGTINLSNGALNIKLPLGSVGGRGFSLPLALNYSSKVWSASRESNFADQTGYHPVAYAKYADIENLIDIYSRVAPGWTIGAAPTLVVRGNGINDNPATTCSGDFKFGLTKLTVILPDKGEIQLRDDMTDGAPLTALLDPSTNCTVRDGNRGQRWHASDGSGTVFISDTANGIVRGDLNGVLILSNGTRYRFASLYNPPPGSPALDLMGIVKILARATSITDHNGNLISITYPTGNEVRYTDQLGRVTKIQKGVPDPANPAVTLNVLVTFPGYQSQNRYFKVKSAVMNQRYRTGINPTLPVINGDYDPLGWGLSWGTATRLFPLSHGLDAERIDTQAVMSEFVLPDGRSIEFFYNEYGEVAEVRLPTGGKLQYDYQSVSALPAGKSHVGEVRTSHFDSNVSDIERSVIARRTYSDGTTLEATWAYSYTSTTAQVTALSASGSVLLKQKHYFLPSGRYLNSPSGTGPVPDRGTEGTGYSMYSTGIESRTETLDATGTVVLAANEEDWTQRTTVSWSVYTTYAQEQPENDNRVNQSRRYLENGMMVKTETTYDQYNNPIEAREYDFDQLLKRRTTTSYLSWNNGFNYQTNDSIHMLSLPETTTVYNSAGTQIAQTVNEYDVYIDDGNHASFTNYGTVSQHDSANYGVSKLTRGNVTRAGRWLNTAGAFIYSHFRFDVTGNVVSTKDANGNVTTISFADDFGPGQAPGTPTQNPATPTYALPTLITSPAPLPAAPVHTARSQYDYSTGLLTGFCDRNNTVTQTIYNDPFNRPTQVKSALGVSGVETHSSMYYAPSTVYGITLSKNDSLTATDLNAVDDASIRAWSVTDGFGRTTESWTRDPQGDVKSISVYDGLGRVTQVSNPFRPATESAVYTTTVYDLVGRVTSVTTPDNAAVNTSYVANTTTVTDQSGKSRKSVTDGLGRLIEVYEDPNGLNYLTTYTYDMLDNLVRVTQGTQQRFFMYDSLKRLIRARNPEQGTHVSLNLSDPLTGNSAWSSAYQYDANGNVSQKTDARGVVSTYVYDALNRNTTVDYSDTVSINPDVKRFYDGATNGKGRFWYFYTGGDYYTGDNVDCTSVDSYDAVGRPLVQRQLFKLNGTWSPTYQVSRIYNRAGGVTSQTYPSGHSVAYNYDSAGRLADKDALNLALTGNLGDGVQRTYSSGNTYSPWGTLTMERFGTQTALYHKLQYNIRGQLWDVRVATGSDVNGSWNRGALQFFYDGTYGLGSSGPDNNGNVLKSKHYVPLDESSNTWAIHDQTYSYDALNRLGSVTESFVSSSQSQTQQSLQSYNYDRWGNRTINPASWGTGINTKQFTVDSATNRLGVGAGQSGVMTYDAAGNLKTDTYSGAGNRAYDAENRMTEVADNTGQTSRYTYNADGQRTRRQVAGSQEQWQIYGFDGELLAEYRASSLAASVEKEYGYRNGQLLVTATGRFNVALAANGAVASASSAHTCCGFSTTGAINGNNRGPWGLGEGWNDATENQVPDWIQVDFAGSKTIDEISVFSLHDNYTQENTPTETQTFSLYGLLAFDVQYWNGSSWVTIPGGSVTGNNKVWRKFMFSPVTTNKIRVFINAVPDAWSRVVEIQAFGTSAGGEKVQWLVPDQLGTPRIIVDETGSLAGVKRHDYLPFGEELLAGTGIRTVAMGYTDDAVRQQFTQKERDAETGLDYFGARYFASVQGRFTSPDPLLQSARAVLPQSWNRYAYVLNNPLRLIDPNGLADTDANEEEQKRQEQQRQEQQQQTQVVDLRKDKVITAEVNKIQADAKPLAEGVTPVLSDVRVVIGETVSVNNGTVIDGYGNYTEGFTGVVRPVAYIPLNQNGNIIEGNGVAVQESVRVVSGEKPRTTDEPAPTPKGGVFIDVQLLASGRSTTTIQQAVFVGQFPRSGGAATSVFRTGVNEITKNADTRTVSVKLGATQRVR